VYVDYGCRQQCNQPAYHSLTSCLYACSLPSTSCIHEIL